jgi:hypothetical protein
MQQYQAGKDVSSLGWSVNHGNSAFPKVYTVNDSLQYMVWYTTGMMDAESTIKYHAHTCA